MRIGAIPGRYAVVVDLTPDEAHDLARLLDPHSDPTPVSALPSQADLALDLHSAANRAISRLPGQG